MSLIFNLLQSFISILLSFISILGFQFNTTTVELYENPSSGYSWEYSFDEQGILILNDTRYTPDTASAVAGKGGGTRSFTFRSINSGTVNVTFEYVKQSGNSRDVVSRYVYSYMVDDGEIILLNVA